MSCAGYKSVFEVGFSLQKLDISLLGSVNSLLRLGIAIKGQAGQEMVRLSFLEVLGC